MGKRAVTDRDTECVQKLIETQFLPSHPKAAVTVYRYNSASIRVRVVDPVFHGKSIVAREAEVLPIIRGLPDRLEDQITVLLLLSPSESGRSGFSAEFDDPRPSRL